MHHARRGTVIELERLVKLALDELGETEAADVEEHVLACGSCAATLERLLRLGDAVREVVRAGKLAFPATGGLVTELERAGLVSRSYLLAPDRIVPCAVSAEDIYAVTTFEADLRGVERVDIVRTVLGRSIRMNDVPFDAESGLVRIVSRSDVLRTLPTTRIKLELFAVEGSGERRLSEYFLDHTGASGAG
jgi:hypothetical protein